MVKIFSPKKQKRQPKRLQTLTIDELDYSGNGVCLSTSPITIVPQALPDERIKVEIAKSSKTHQRASVIEVIEKSPLRVAPFCPHYQVCGGCNTQHLAIDDGLSLKTAALINRLKKQVGIQPDVWHKPISSPRAYRRKVRFAIDARNPRQIKIGYRKASSSDIVDIDQCPILTKKLQNTFASIRTILLEFNELTKVGHIQLIESNKQTALSINLTRAVSPDSMNWLQHQLAYHNCLVEITHGESIVFSNLNKNVIEIDSLEKVSLQHGSRDFMQGNHEVNIKMLRQAINWLALDGTHVLYDFFAGVGNFSLALAKNAKQVLAYEVIDAMVEKCAANAKRNGCENIHAYKVDLDDETQVSQLSFEPHASVVLDPARAGAMTLCKKLTEHQLKKILYVSCNPNTFIRDLAILSSHYQVSKISTLDMFPFTEHMEVMALLERKQS